MNLNLILLQAQAAPPPGGNMTMVFIMIAMFIIMYFFMILPQQKRAKEQKKFTDSITSGEMIITTAGIHGRINRENEDGTLQLEISRATFMTIDRSAVSMEMTQAYRKKNNPAAAPATASAVK
jgi:preprotein translocase subunit YajC